MVKTRIVAIALIALLGACAVHERQAAPAPAVGGFSAQRLARLTRFIQDDIDAKRMPGVVVVAVRDGKVVYSQVMGVRDPKSNAPMTEDAIFRIYSMTKPIVSLGILMLVEEGRIALAAPISQYLPELKDLKVGVEKPGPDGKPLLDLAAATRQPTVQDLLRHTSGVTAPGEATLVTREYAKSGLEFGTITGSETFVKSLARAPLAYQPGTTWEYGISTSVLGVLIERLSGQSLDVFLRERVFAPLRMDDTGFWVAPEKQGRIAEPFEVNPFDKSPTKLLEIRSRPAFPDGAGGLVSTAKDYMRFAQMMLNGGELDGVRIASRKTIEYMTSDHLGGITGPNYWFGPGYGFGLGVAVRTSAGLAPFHGSPGDYWWIGFAGTAFWVDPKERLVAVFFTQAPGFQMRNQRVFRNMLYSAME